MGSLISTQIQQPLLGLPASKTVFSQQLVQQKLGSLGINLSQSYQSPSPLPGFPMSLGIKCEVLTHGL